MDDPCIYFLRELALTTTRTAARLLVTTAIISSSSVALILTSGAANASSAPTGADQFAGTSPDRLLGIPVGTFLWVAIGAVALIIGLIASSRTAKQARSVEVLSPSNLFPTPAEGTNKRFGVGVADIEIGAAS